MKLCALYSIWRNNRISAIENRLQLADDGI